MVPSEASSRRDSSGAGSGSFTPTWTNPTSTSFAGTAYVDRNVAAVREVAERVAPDLALANHLVMAPAILARGLPAAVPYAVLCVPCKREEERG